MSRQRTAAATLHTSFTLETTHKSPDHAVISPPKVTVVKGALLLDGEFVEQSQVDNTRVIWSRKLKSQPGVWEHGNLHVSRTGFSCSGAIGRGIPSRSNSPNAMTFADLTTVILVTGVADQNDYTFRYIPQAYPTANAARQAAKIQGSSPCWTISTGVKKPRGGLICFIEAIDKVSEGARLYQGTVDATDYSTITATVTVITGKEQTFLNKQDTVNQKNKTQFPKFGKASFTVDIISNTAKGYLQPLKEEEDPMGGTIWSLDNNAFQPLYWEETGTHFLKTCLNTAAEQPNKNSWKLLTRLASLPNAALPQPADLAYSLAEGNSAMFEQSLSVRDLLTIDTPVHEDQTKNTQNLIAKAASYWRSDDDKQTWGDPSGALHDVLGKEFTDNLDKEKRTFLTDTYSKAMLLTSVATNDQFARNFSDEQQTKLHYFWLGKVRITMLTT